MKRTWTISQENAGERLDVFLADAIPELTRSRAAKLLKSGAGTVNGRPATVHRFLNPGDTVIFDDAPVGSTPEMDLPPPEIHIIDETPAYYVIDKPVGVLVHPNTKLHSGTLVEAILARDPSIAKIGEDPQRPGIIHRLDRDVSGLMLVARTQDAFEHLKKQFSQHTIDKRYLALVYGEIPEDEGELKFRIARSKTRNRMAARPESEEGGKAAWTHYTVLKRFRGATLVECTILSGRTHQIRAHFLAFGHPVIGDPLYKRRAEDRNIKAPRLLLQSVHIGFNDPVTGELRTYDIAPDPSFEDVMKTL